MPVCPHIKVGLSIDYILGMYKRKPVERHKNDTFICLKCGYKNGKSTLSQHAHQQHAHQIAVQVKTMKIWCFRCKTTLADNSGHGSLKNLVSDLIELPFFYTKASQAATSTSKSNVLSIQVASPGIKTNACVKSKAVVTDQKNFKTRLPVSRSSNTCVVKQDPAVIRSQEHNYQPIRNNAKKDKNKEAYNPTVTKLSIKVKKNTPVQTDYKLGGDRRRYNHKSSMLNNGSEQLSVQNHLKVSGNLKNEKKSYKESKNNGKFAIVSKSTGKITYKPPTSKCIGGIVSKFTDEIIHKPIDRTVSKSSGITLSKPAVGTISKPIHGTVSKVTRKTIPKSITETISKPTDGTIYCLPIPKYKPIVGLKNVGNTCFFNSVLQVIYQSRYLHYYINMAMKCPCKSKLEGPEGLLEFTVTKPPGQLTSAVNRFLNEMGSQAEVRNPVLLLNTLATSYKRFRGFDQQDSHEVFRCLLDGLKMEEIKRYQEGVTLKLTENSLVRAEYEKLARKSRTFVDETFGGILSSTVICRSCCTPTQLAEPFFDLSLSISGLRKRKHGNSEVEDPHRICHFLKCRKQLYYQLKEYKENDRFDTLEACLRSYTTLEVLNDDNKFICDTCTKYKANDSLASISKSSLDNLVLCPVSKLLLLHELPKILVLHLKRFKLGSMVTKDNRHIDFPFELDVAPYCTNYCERYMKDNRIMYSLYGVVVHHGSLHGGHYTAYVKAAGIHNTTMWYYASDSHVRSARVDEIKKSNAYMLFYESIDMQTD